MRKRDIKRVIGLTKGQLYDHEMKVRGLEKAVRTVLETGCRKATAYISDSMVATVSARHRPDKRHKSTEFVVKLGAPNFLERRFIRQCKKVGMCFPIRQVQIRWWPKKGGRK